MIAAFLIGFLGSWHCVGMCGPLNLMLISKSRSMTSFFIYHTGRLIAYILLGLFLGAIGFSVGLFQAQQFMTILLGAAILLLYGVPSFRRRIERFYYTSRFYQSIKNLLNSSFSQSNQWFVSGVANGFLPCGLTYVAAAGAIITGSYLQGMLLMFLFGLGTMPALAIISLGGLHSPEKLKKLIPGSMTLVALLSGGILVLRGLLVVSPQFNELIKAHAAGLITVCGL